jgi:hypothetical protein
MQIGPRAYLAIAFLGVGLGACGSSSSTTTRPAASGDQSAQAQIQKNWVEFFSPSSSATTKETLLQNGKQFAPIIESLFKSPLAQGVSAKVSAVKLTSPTTATVTYTVSVAGQPVLKNSTGTAVKSGNTWQVGDGSFCQLLKLEGSTPPGCPKG